MYTSLQHPAQGHNDAWPAAGATPGAVDEARRIKPQIPLIGLDGIPIHDEIELEMILPAAG